MICVYVRRILPCNHKSAQQNQHDTAWALLADLLQGEYGVSLSHLPLAIGERGKPYFTDSFVHFSLSHTKEIAVCAIGDAPVGVDAEPQGRHISAALRARFLPECGANCPNEVAVAAWTAKEAYGKMTGEGVLSTSNAPYHMQSLFAYRHIITVCAQTEQIAKDVLSY